MDVYNLTINYRTSRKREVFCLFLTEIKKLFIMIRFIKAFVSLPFAMLVSSLFFIVSKIAIAKFQGFFFGWVFYYFETLFPSIITGFILLFVFLYLIDAKQKSKNMHWTQYVITIFYLLVVLVLFTTFVVNMTPNSYNIEANLNFGNNSDEYKFIVLGCILGTIFYFKSGHLKKIPLDEVDLNKLDNDENYFVQELINKKKWRKLNTYFLEIYDEDFSNLKLSKEDLKDLLDSKL